MLAHGRATCETLRREGRSVALFSMPTVKPLDVDAISVPHGVAW